ncbi:type I restriction endonuclease subunit R [Neolewinella antarctica]|uniref:type I site-specific deoxyribonuclease n=1 Tax=Neolewinella antarctica TaxID=442734 RepID=A0ABX0X967_9BACT|nr:type I restriction endonuclease [Neolewinella antarctica]NJC25809.1 type I restriction enzyme R subunit [Neolewinella antarctica]
MNFNEDTRVKIPAILHLCRLGYTYLALSRVQWEEESNIFLAQFRESLLRINPGSTPADVDRAYQDVLLNLGNHDLGEAFFKQLTDQTSFRLLDLEHFGNNSFHVVTELPYKHGDEEFRPDIICLVNGMPLAFVEVKKPNNIRGLHAEQDRMKTRASLPAFRKFMNLTQLMIFSNNMEYDDSTSAILQGAFYAAPAYGKPVFNYFREEEDTDWMVGPEPSDELENQVLKDVNYQTLKHSPDFLLSKAPGTPTNRILTSLLSRDRLEFLLKYAFAYVRESSGLQKHVMRYPQLFATRAIGKKLTAGVKKGIVWHTQGSGKTALAYYNVKYLTEHFRKVGTIPKFYFIVDRLDLLTQASKEFGARGLTVHHVNSRKDFLADIKKQTATHNAGGQAEITVVNIQKFSDDSTATAATDYAIDIQRVYFLDEVHRSYNPRGSFLANLERSDPGAIKIGLTGTPLLSTDYDSKDLFGDYFHKYYYNASIADGYTLRLIREEISTRYKMAMEAALKEVELLKGTFSKKEIYAHEKFVAPMLRYITEDFAESRSAAGPLHADVGAMVVCDSSEQARELYRQFRELEISPSSPALPNNPAPATAQTKNAEMITGEIPHQPYVQQVPSKAALILHDNGSKQDRKDWVDDFKDGKIDYLFVYNMLLTGFDAKRLKKLYLTRIIRRHNLLQALTRVNRTYKDARYGYVVDFADISSEFAATNRDYFNELQAELGDEMEHYSKLFKTEEEINAEIEEIKDFLFAYDTENPEAFSRQLSEITDLETMRGITKQLTGARELYNLIRLKGQREMMDKLDFKMIAVLSREANNRLALLRERDALDNASDNSSLLNMALEDIVFLFTKVGENELRLADELKGNLRQTREALADNFDKRDPEYVSLYEELERLFRGKQLDETGQEDMIANNQALVALRDKVRELNRKNRQLKSRYGGDEKAARVHKRLREKDSISLSDRLLFDSVTCIKDKADDRVLKNQDVLTNEAFFERSLIRSVISEFRTRQKLPLGPKDVTYINQLIVGEYVREFRGL